MGLVVGQLDNKRPLGPDGPGLGPDGPGSLALSHTVLLPSGLDGISPRSHSRCARPHMPAMPPFPSLPPAAVQCLVNQLLISSFFGTRLVHGALVLWGGMPLWSTLGPEDTAALTTLAAKALAPAARAAQQVGPWRARALGGCSSFGNQ